MITPAEYLEEIYSQCMALNANEDFIHSPLPREDKEYLDLILEHSESAKAVLTVLLTSIVYKQINPGQDIRNHQDSIVNGYSGRTFDYKYITPFLKGKRFPAMKETGWLTRSFEQKQPYLLTYPGAIKPDKVKRAFLECIDRIQKGANCENYLKYILQGLIIKRNKQVIDLAKPTNLTITSILNLLEDHFNAKYKAEGVSRLPVLAFYAIMPSLSRQFSIYR